MPWETIGSLVLGFALAAAATRWLPERFPDRALVLATGPVAALLGGVIARVVVGAGHPAAILAIATGVSVAMLSLLMGGGVRTGFRPDVTARPHVP
ncbi:hypothetical protein [Streptomyces oceani]|uniref:Uncharacterized protein n=1 Tax=Streptomyces oceani TaxID=1075402 RepID=A0A1E7KPU0_9ACTN|nr:hypothetical protein [Streptomyces oceani]OEV05938.1 hypothetical protein AN216_01335 [Streptomyces oceani]